MRFTYAIFALFFLCLIAIIILTKIVATPTNSRSDYDVGIRVSTSSYPIYFLTAEIVGDRAKVINLTPPGVEPHDFEPSLKDIALIEQSQIVFINGNLEPWAEKLSENLKSKNVAVSDFKDLMIDGDPHVWLSPKLAILMVRKITTKLSTIDQLNKSYYESNAKELITKLTELDKNFTNGFAKCQTKNFVTSHKAFTYLASDYNLNQISVAGLTPEEEPSLAQIAKIVKQTRELGIKYIFLETLSSSKIAQTIANETGIQTLVLHPIENLTQQQKSANSTYFSLMQENLTNLKIALTCQ